MTDGDTLGVPLFLTIDEVLHIHDHQIETYGGDPGVRDLHLLESAIAQPAQQFDGQYLHADLAAMAAAYFYHIVLNHPFVDGNKRTGAHAALVFLGMNDTHVDYPVDETEDLTLRVAAGQASKDEAIAFFRQLLSGE